jgi:complex III assembly factor LYRM7
MAYFRTSVPFVARARRGGASALIAPARSVSSVTAYRELLKAQRSLFKGDAPARVAARLETRQHFLANANASPEEAAALAADAFDTAGFLRENVAQTVLNERGNYELKPSPQHIHTGATPPPLPGCSESFNEPAKSAVWSPAK